MMAFLLGGIAVVICIGLALKGYLIAKGWHLIKTHDLEELVAKAASFDPSFSRFARFAEELTEDFFAQHYPGQDWSQVGLNYETLRQQAGELVLLIQALLPQQFPPPASLAEQADKSKN